MNSATACLIIEGAMLGAALAVFLAGVIRPLSRHGDGPVLLHGGALVDAWIPLLFVLPLVLQAPATGAATGDVGWIGVGGPVTIGAIVLGTALWVGDRGGGEPARLDSTIVWGTVGAIVLLVLASHAILIVEGQVLFAMGAVLLWWRTTRTERRSPPIGADVARAEDRRARAMLVATALAAAGGVAGARAAVLGAQGPAAALALAPAALAAIPVARSLGRGWAVRAGGWSATLGVLFGIGGLSLARLLPRLTGQDPAGLGLGRGFGHYALEGVLLLLLPMAARAPLSRPGRRVAGFLLAGLGAAVAIARLRGP